MKKTLLFLAVLPVILPAFLLAAGTENQDVKEELTVIEKKPRISIPETYGSSKLTNWYVLDNRNLVIEVNNREKYKATLMNSCTGLRFTDTIGFSTMGPFELDKWTSIILPDGHRCYIKELTRYHPDKDN